MVNRLFSIRPRPKKRSRAHIYGGAVLGLAGFAFCAIAPILVFAQTAQIDTASQQSSDQSGQQPSVHSTPSSVLSRRAAKMAASMAKPSNTEVAESKSLESNLEPTAAPTTPEAIELANAITRPNVRSIWLDRETIVNAGSAKELAKVFDRFKAAGINTVFVETVNAGYPIYESAIAPERNPLIQGWDPLQAAIDLGKSHDMEIHAWVWLFAVGNQAHNRIVGQPMSYPGPILSARPDWAGFDSRGNLIIPGQTKTFLDPANPEARQYLLELLSEIAARYDVDGIQFDYVRYPFQDAYGGRHFGYGTAAREKFLKLTGVDPITLSPRNGGDSAKAYLWNQWTAFRTQQITTFVSEASRRLQRLRPDLKLSAAVFADGTYQRQLAIQQDWEDWADQGLLDWIVLMSYANTVEEFSGLVRPWTVESSYRSTKVIPGIRLLNLPAAEARNQLQLLKDLSTEGYALFAADNLHGEVQSMLAGLHGQEQQNASAPAATAPIASAPQRGDRL
ncbi:glycoside hydrolase family 10 protein [cf. Phormidesmis sp. LEGE 11477]|uniref:glycoside hydrolase family 10 protein n=1 Tax=cf. Phormidesmis sp. LEGE 11477 TaxID=1828680 RepID=UPI001880B0E4|nr:family 10 glycosylhydrolase [cf. Phormidesmis sp. LEGE 11477]MBE9063614.1 family 10 glycosylhydrolase [cf. Phormidesmis sp. LEGE 11477]